MVDARLVDALPDPASRTLEQVKNAIVAAKALNGVNPEAYIAATLRKILDNHMQRDIAELLPWNFSE